MFYAVITVPVAIVYYLDVDNGKGLKGVDAKILNWFDF